MNGGVLSRIRSWEFNPMVVKELRQSMHSWFVAGAIILLLVTFFFITLNVLLFREVGVVRSNLGMESLSVFMGFMSMVTLGFIPSYVGVRMAMERTSINAELMYITTLTPERIIRGKLISGFALLFLFYCACLPFMALCYLLRGVDVPTIFLFASLLFLINCLIIQAAIFTAALPAHWILKALLGAFFWMFLASFMLFGIGFFVFSGLRGGGSFTFDSVEWPLLLSQIGVGLLVWGLLYFGSVALISPHSYNRALPLRLYCTAMWLLGGVLAVGWSLATKDYDISIAWLVCTLIFASIALLPISCSRDSLNPRLRKSIPRNRLLRILHFVFSNGSLSGYLWLSLMVLTTIVLLVWLEINLASIRVGSIGETSLNCLVIYGYLLAYALTAQTFRRWVMSNSNPKWTSLFFLLQPLLIYIIMNIAVYMIYRGDVFSVFQPGNLFNYLASNSKFTSKHGICVSIWLALLFCLNIPWFRHLINRYHSSTPNPKPLADAGTVPPKLD